jgi:acetyltransferase-like isoleucine patch superfamily enzyme
MIRFLVTAAQSSRSPSKKKMDVPIFGAFSNPFCRSKGLNYGIEPAIHEGSVRTGRATVDSVGAWLVTAAGEDLHRAQGDPSQPRPDPHRAVFHDRSKLPDRRTVARRYRDRTRYLAGPRCRVGRVRASATLTELGAGVTIGDYVGLGDGFLLGAFRGIEIGPGTIVGERLTVNSDNHDFNDPTRGHHHPALVDRALLSGQQHVTVLGEVENGPDSDVGAGAGVTKPFTTGSVIASPSYKAPATAFSRQRPGRGRHSTDK